jgi:hypothetical protein
LIRTVVSLQFVTSATQCRTHGDHDLWVRCTRRECQQWNRFILVTTERAA